MGRPGLGRSGGGSTQAFGASFWLAVPGRRGAKWSRARTSANRSREKCPGLGAPRRKRAPKPRWAFGWIGRKWLHGHVHRLPMLARGPRMLQPGRSQAEKSAQAFGALVRPRQSRHMNTVCLLTPKLADCRQSNFANTVLAVSNHRAVAARIVTSRIRECVTPLISGSYSFGTNCENFIRPVG
jgi:hypothetical protein